MTPCCIPSPSSATRTASGRRSTAASATSSTGTPSTPPTPCPNRHGSASLLACTTHPAPRARPRRPTRPPLTTCPACTPGDLMDFSTADEHLALRQAVAAITAQFGNDYYTRKAEAREFTSELWQALGKHG